MVRPSRSPSPGGRCARGAALALLVSLAFPAWADHGPGTTGGALNVVSGETLQKSKVAFDLRFDYTSFEPLTTGEIASKAKKGGEFDFLDWTLLTTATASYGLTDEVQLNFTTGWYHANGAGSAEFDSGTGTTDFATFDPDGLTDSWVTAKWRFAKGPAGSFAVYGGEKIPTGRDDVTNSAGETVERSSTAGSGSWDSLLGI